MAAVSEHILTTPCVAVKYYNTAQLCVINVLACLQVINSLLARNVLSKQFVLCAWMVDFCNPVYSPHRLALMAYVPSECELPGFVFPLVYMRAGSDKLHIIQQKRVKCCCSSLLCLFGQVSSVLPVWEAGAGGALHVVIMWPAGETLQVMSRRRLSDCYNYDL